MTWIREIESAKYIAEMRTSNTTTGAELQNHFEVLDSEIVSGLKKIINGDLKKKSRHSRRSWTQRKTLPHWKTSRMDDL